MFFIRCTAPANDLDGKIHPRRSEGHTEVITKAFELGELWSEYGLVGDVVVSISSFACYIGCSRRSSRSQPFTSYFPRADIHELLTPDLLHQLIKGTFKDHLVTWIVKYITDKYSKDRANQILDDIDRRLVFSLLLYPFI